MQISHVTWRGRRCWLLTNNALQVVITQWGAQFAEICFVSPPSMNPLWIPPWPTMDADQYQPDLHEAIYGGNSESRLLSGIAGHTLCFPFWGDPTEAEYHAGMTLHGEANLVQWQLERATGERAVLTGSFPESQMSISREITLEGSQLECKSRARNLSAWDRPVAWCEHVTFGPPFLQAGVTTFEAPAEQGFRTGQEDGEQFLWPQGRGKINCDLSTFSRQEHRDLVNSFLMSSEAEAGFIRARNAELGLEIEYRFTRRDYPWLNVWENHDARMLTRGMEFSNTPRHGTMRTLIKAPEVLGTPAYEWIDAKGEMEKSFQVELRRL